MVINVTVSRDEMRRKILYGNALARREFDIRTLYPPFNPSIRLSECEMSDLHRDLRNHDDEYGTDMWTEWHHGERSLMEELVFTRAAISPITLNELLELTRAELPINRNDWPILRRLKKRNKFMIVVYQWPAPFASSI